MFHVAFLNQFFPMAKNNAPGEAVAVNGYEPSNLESISHRVLYRMDSLYVDLLKRTCWLGGRVGWSSSSTNDSPKSLKEIWIQCYLLLPFG